MSRGSKNPSWHSSTTSHTSGKSFRSITQISSHFFRFGQNVLTNWVYGKVICCYSADVDLNAEGGAAWVPATDFSQVFDFEDCRGGTRYVHYIFPKSSTLAQPQLQQELTTKL